MTQKKPNLLVRVANRRPEALDIISLELTAVDGGSLPPFSAGSHIDVDVGNELVRQYSLCNDPRESHRYLISVLRDPKSRGGSLAVHDTIKLGDVIKISEPKNHFALVPSRRSLLFAGGIGITPILCMAEWLQHAGSDFEFHYCARSIERMAFRAHIARSEFADRVSLHFDKGDASQKLDAAVVLAEKGTDVNLYVCGPAGFIDHIVTTAKSLGWLDSNIHLEHFGAPPADTSGDAAFQVKISSTGAVYDIPANCSVIRVLEQHGIDVPVSCEQGVCGTCLTRVIAGQPDHRDLFLTDAERAANDQFTPCCSRSKSAILVLDL